MGIPPNTIIPAGDTTVPAGTVTVITGYTGVPSTNIGGITQSNGFFTLPATGNYSVVANICFAAVPAVLPTDIRIVSIYKVDALTGIVTNIGMDSRTPVAATPTCINVATTDTFRAFDRVFIAVRQTNGAALAILTVPDVGRLAITRLN